jgi:hypothetical protein
MPIPMTMHVSVSTTKASTGPPALLAALSVIVWREKAAGQPGSQRVHQILQHNRAVLASFHIPISMCISLYTHTLSL